MPDEHLIFLSAGEASGDHYGAELIRSLLATLPGATFTGLGGQAMEAAGQQRVVRAEDVAVMGITEIVRHIPRILLKYRALVRSVYANVPQVAVLIDFPDVNFRLARHLHRLGVPVVWFVSPQLWAWKRRRLRWVQSRVSKMLTIFPFEENFYRNRGVDAEFVGHPLAEAALPTVPRQDYATQFDLDPSKTWIALLPGSRRVEIAANLPTLLAAAPLLSGSYQFVIPVAPGISGAQLRWIEDQLPGADTSEPRVVLVHDARAALLHSRAAVIASGTATVQAAVLGTPFVAVYRVSKTTFCIARRLVRYPQEIGAEPDEHGNLPIVMPNLIAGFRVVPEMLQQHFTATSVAQALEPLLQDGPAREAQLRGLAGVRRSLLHPSGTRSMDRLRDAVLDALKGSSTAASSPGTVSASNLRRQPSTS